MDTTEIFNTIVGIGKCQYSGKVITCAREVVVAAQEVFSVLAIFIGLRFLVLNRL